MWRGLDERGKQPWRDLQKKEEAEFKLKHPDYTYQPRKTEEIHKRNTSAKNAAGDAGSLNHSVDAPGNVIENDAVEQYAAENNAEYYAAENDEVEYHAAENDAGFYAAEDGEMEHHVANNAEYYAVENEEAVHSGAENEEVEYHAAENDAGYYAAENGEVEHHVAENNVEYYDVQDVELEYYAAENHAMKNSAPAHGLSDYSNVDIQNPVKFDDPFMGDDSELPFMDQWEEFLGIRSQ